MKAEFLMLVADQLEREITEGDLAASIESLGLDSLEFMELVMEIETSLGCTVDTEDIPVECTLQDVLDRLRPNS